MAEIELSHLRRQCLGGRIAAKATLIKKVQAWNIQRNEKHAKAHWQFTTDDARVKLRRLYPIISTSKHPRAGERRKRTNGMALHLGLEWSFNVSAFVDG